MSRNYDLHEFYADEFACSLLMPVAEFLIRVEQGWKPMKLAKHFGVPKEQVIRWGQSLARKPPNDCTEFQHRLLRAVFLGKNNT